MLPFASVNPYAPGREQSSGGRGSLFNSECLRGAKRELEDVDIPDNGAKRQCSGSISYQEVLTEFSLENYLNCDKYSFEMLKTYVLKPEDDFGEALKIYGKVALDPELEYTISSSFSIKSKCYVIGNGARVKISCPSRYPISVLGFSYFPRFYGMWSVTFTNVIFERDRATPGGLFDVKREIQLYGCQFHGFLGNVLNTEGTCVVRGCYFVACFKCVNNTAVGLSNTVPTTVENCVFEKCMIAVMSKGRAKLKGNSTSGTYCFLHAEAEVEMINNSITNPYQLANTAGIEMVTCSVGEVMPLASVHIARNKKASWPKFEGNVFLRARLYLGRRKGMFEPRCCSFAFSQIYIDSVAFNKVSLHAVSGSTFCVVKVLPRLEVDPTVQVRYRACICSNQHEEPQMNYVDMTAHALPNAYVNSVETGQFSSDEDDD